MMMIHCVFSNGDAHSDLDCSTLAFAIAHYNKTHSRGHGKTHKFRIHSSVSNNNEKVCVVLVVVVGMWWLLFCVPEWFKVDCVARGG